MYKNNHATTYPAAGGEGNSVAAAAPYRDGTFGPWSGTPTFIVIAPDGNLQYDVFGFGHQGTIEALDDAIAATGAQGIGTSTKPSLPAEQFTVSGIVGNEITISSKDNGKFQITILDISGKILDRKALHFTHTLSEKLDASALASGPFVCRIENIITHEVASYLCVKM
jgi:hypothetical protein